MSNLLRAHPDYARWLKRAGDGDADRVAFVEASTWPDDIRQDPRFYSAGVDEPTPTLPGFPDMERRRKWHYVNRPLDDTRQNNARNLARSDPVSGLLDQQLVALVKILGAPGTPAISAGFFDNAREIANRRVAQAGYRLDDLLRELFSKK